MLGNKDLSHHRIRLLSLSLRDFRGFGNLKLDFGDEVPISVLIANNGSGKTSILDAIADFLRFTLAKGILGADYEKEVFGDVHQSLFNLKDIKNDEAAALCEARFQLTYNFPARELFEVVRDITSYLNDYQLGGKKALLKLFGERDNEDWTLIIEESENAGKREKLYNSVELPEDIIQQLDILIKPDGNGNIRLRSEDEFDVAFFINDTWQPNFNISIADIAKIEYTGVLNIKYELNKSGSRFIIPNMKADNIDAFITQLIENVAFLEDFRESAKAYYAKEDKKSVLPLLTYYGGAAINTKFGEISISYSPLLYQAYKEALVPERFNFEEFFEWFNALSEESAHKIDLVKDSILEVLNADQEPGEKVYSYLRIEKGTLKLDKKIQQNSVPISIEISQLSAGEKNLFALIGDLVKRAIQLNPILFELDYDQEIGTYENPLHYTYGVVLIDEIDLHLHPKWQRQIVPKLRQLFPEVQFVVTTHSPFVLQSVEKGKIISLPDLDKWNGLSGWEIYEIIQDAMADQGDSLSEKYQKEMNRFNDAILYDNMNQMEDSYRWLIKHLHPNNPKRLAIEMQYNVFFRKNEYK
jgi:predicted ATP-binding protein involved in virulence